MNECLIIAGEKSGEEHAMSFLKTLQSLVPNVNFFGVGGDLMKDCGVELTYHLNDFSTWGISQAVTKIPFYYKALKKIENEVDKRNCKVAILIDYQTFNLKLAARLAKKGVKILYYVAPQAWAWKEKRVKTLEECVDTLFCIIPFEKEWFMSRGVSKAVSIKHPLINHYEEDLDSFSRERKNLEKDEVNLLLLPGSRNFEVTGLLPNFVKAANKLKEKYNIRVSLVESSSVNEHAYSCYREHIDKVYTDKELQIALKEADFAFAASGTVNLACALYELPTVVAYTGSLLNEFVFDSFVNYDGYISLANIVHQKEVFPELVTPRDSVYNLVKFSSEIFENEIKYNEIMNDLSKTREIVSGGSFNVPQYLAEKIRESYED